ncbi:hypothetical protein FHS27_002061 [Rhodopirellula rubra]|uniref:Transmembrane protein n=1 Tax=Aporhodopirellula rubra TaxID=980271 RepID=A0A7W5DZ02_9BACT|nr:hypothetical protein [Aporhodopirellula rubra]
MEIGALVSAGGVVCGWGAWLVASGDVCFSTTKITNATKVLGGGLFVKPLSQLLVRIVRLIGWRLVLSYLRVVWFVVGGLSWLPVVTCVFDHEKYE